MQIAPFSGGTVLVWRDISQTAQTELVTLRGGNLTTDHYISSNFLQMQFNAKPHFPHIVQDCLHVVDVEIDLHAVPI